LSRPDRRDAPIRKRYNETGFAFYDCLLILRDIPDIAEGYGVAVLRVPIHFSRPAGIRVAAGTHQITLPSSQMSRKEKKETSMPYLLALNEEVLRPGEIKFGMPKNEEYR
jgi:hypothetical protein